MSAIYKSNLKTLMPRVRKSVQQEVNKTIRLVANQAKRNARGRPGPRVQTGNLINNIKSVFAKGNDTSGRVESLANYSLYLEFGTRYMPEYPFLGPALRQHTKDHFDRINKVFSFGKLI